MRAKRSLLVLLLLVAFAAERSARAQQDASFRVMTYNIHHGENMDGALDLQGIADVLRAHHVDVVGLQEVDHHWSERSEFADQARSLADRLDMNYFFAPILDYAPPEEGKPRRKYGLAILSRFPILEAENFNIERLPSVGENPRRQQMGGFPMATLDVEGTRVHVFNTHLDYRPDPEVRRAQVQDMLAIVDAVEGPKVLVGDLNASPQDDELRPMWSSFVDAWDVRDGDPGYTFPSDDPDRRIDYILTTPGFDADSVVVVETQASDHRPVLADLTLPPVRRTRRSMASQQPVKTGAARLAEGEFARLRDRRVGLVVNHTARVDTTHLIDLLHQTGVEIGAIFGPEHGIRGTANAGEVITGGHDEATNTPIYSLYDDTRKPTPEELEGLDALVFDVQDVGARFYTYITTMGWAMQSAAEADLPFIVLDRPNPLGGTYTSGFLLEPEHHTFVGQYPIPIAHGLTVGELARMIQGEAWLPGVQDVDLEVVEMEGWKRAMQWPETGLPWIHPSPNLPTFETALVYSGTCFFEATTEASEGRGTRRPFAHLGAPWADGRVLADTLAARDVPGARFHAARFTPEPNAGDASPKFEGEELQGIRIEVTDTSAYRPVETGIHVLHAFYHQARDRGVEDFFTSYLASLAGTDDLQEMLRSGARPGTIIAAWQDEVRAFRERRRRYLLY